MKQWKRPKTIYRNLSYLNRKHQNGISHEELFNLLLVGLTTLVLAAFTLRNSFLSNQLLTDFITRSAAISLLVNISTSVANSRLGWYRRCGMNVVNYIISKDLLENRIKDGAGLLNPLSYYLVKVGI